MISLQEVWNRLTPEDQAKYWAKEGAVNDVMILVMQGKLATLSDEQQRELVSLGFLQAANLHDKLSSEGIIPQIVLQNPILFTETLGYSARQRERAREIMENPQNLPLIKQLLSYMPPIK